MSVTHTNVHLVSLLVSIHNIVLEPAIDIAKRVFHLYLFPIELFANVRIRFIWGGKAILDLMGGHFPLCNILIRVHICICCIRRRWRYFESSIP